MTLLIFSLCSSSPSPWCRPPRCKSCSAPLPLPAFDSVSFYVFVLVFAVYCICSVSWPSLYIVFCPSRFPCCIPLAFIMDKWKSKHRLSWVGQSTNSVYIYPERQKRNTLVPFIFLTNIIALVAHQVLVFLCPYFRLCSENLVREFWATFEFNFDQCLTLNLNTDLNIWNIIKSSWTIDLNNWTHSTY